jgi:hypothetical protein
MPDPQAQFDGKNPVSGYTLFQGKDGKSYYLKGEGLSDSDVMQRVAKLRGGNESTTMYSKDGGKKLVPNEQMREVMKQGSDGI